jgi:hypothetical protein
MEWRTSDEAIVSSGFLIPEAASIEFWMITRLKSGKF